MLILQPLVFRRFFVSSVKRRVSGLGGIPLAWQTGQYLPIIGFFWLRLPLESFWQFRPFPHTYIILLYANKDQASIYTRMGRQAPQATRKRTCKAPMKGECERLFPSKDTERNDIYHHSPNQNHSHLWPEFKYSFPLCYYHANRVNDRGQRDKLRNLL